MRMDRRFFICALYLGFFWFLEHNDIRMLEFKFFVFVPQLLLLAFCLFCGQVSTDETATTSSRKSASFFSSALFHGLGAFTKRLTGEFRRASFSKLEQKGNSSLTSSVASARSWKDILAENQPEVEMILDYIATFKDMNFDIALKTIIVRGDEFMRKLNLPEIFIQRCMKYLESHLDLILTFRELIMCSRNFPKFSELFEKTSPGLVEMLGNYHDWLGSTVGDFRSISQDIDYESFPVFNYANFSISFEQYEILFNTFCILLEPSYEDTVITLFEFLVRIYQKTHAQVKALTENTSYSGMEVKAKMGDADIQQAEIERIHRVSIYTVLQGFLRGLIDFLSNLGTLLDRMSDYMIHLHFLLEAHWSPAMKVTVPPSDLTDKDPAPDATPPNTSVPDLTLPEYPKEDHVPLLPSTTAGKFQSETSWMTADQTKNSNNSPEPSQFPSSQGHPGSSSEPPNTSANVADFSILFKMNEILARRLKRVSWLKSIHKKYMFVLKPSGFVGSAKGNNFHFLCLFSLLLFII